jgi:site-specific recombinase XerC
MMMMAAPHPGSGQPRRMDAGVLEPEIGSFCLYLAAEGKSPKTIRTYTDAVRWFFGEHLLGQAGKTGWDQAYKKDIQEWMAWLLARGSDSYASNQFRALQQFFKWLSAEEDIRSPMAGLRPPKVADKPVPVFAAREMSSIERVCKGRGFTQRRDAAIIAVLKATGIRLLELAGIRYDPDDPRRSDIDLMEREITVHGKGRRTRTVKISYDAARAVRPVSPRPCQACSGPAPAAVARGEWPRSAQRQRYLPDGPAARRAVRDRCVAAPLPAPLQPYLA